jgi:hypothetical protein
MKDISQHRFGRLIAVRPTGEKRWRVNLWLCLCDCGKEHIAAVNSLKSGLVKSCGCLLRETAKKKATQHGGYGSLTYKSWDAMIQRCTNPNSTAFKNYGAKGVQVCKHWRQYKNFAKDMGDRPIGTSLDRVDPSGNYEPSNCRWATRITQARNKRTTTLTYEQAQQIREMYLQGAGPKLISKTLKVTINQVGSVVYSGNVHSLD